VTNDIFLHSGFAEYLRYHLSSRLTSKYLGQILHIRQIRHPVTARRKYALRSVPDPGVFINRLFIIIKINGGHKQRSGQHTISRKKIYKISSKPILGSSVCLQEDHLSNDLVIYWEHHSTFIFNLWVKQESLKIHVNVYERKWFEKGFHCTCSKTKCFPRNINRTEVQ
jgi:hypothetical protein